MTSLSNTINADESVRTLYDEDLPPDKRVILHLDPLVDLVVFDLDGVLIRAYMENPDKDFGDWDVLPRRLEALELLRAAGIKIGIATNQAGIGYGYNTEDDWATKAWGVRVQLAMQDTEPIAVCFAAQHARDPRWSDPREQRRRKPCGAMIEEIMLQHSLDPGSLVDRERVLMVGDRPEDEGAAADVGYVLDAYKFAIRASLRATGSGQPDSSARPHQGVLYESGAHFFEDRALLLAEMDALDAAVEASLGMGAFGS